MTINRGYCVQSEAKTIIIWMFHISFKLCNGKPVTDVTPFYLKYYESLIISLHITLETTPE